MISEAIILAGGLGTRLRSAVPDLPKCMAPVAGKPFISYLIDYFSEQHIERFVFSLGYKHEVIADHLENYFHKKNQSIAKGGANISYRCSIEDEPLGTGGAILKAASIAQQENVLVLNGDTFFGVDTSLLSAFHNRHAANCTLSLKPMNNSDRYGVVETDREQRIISFKEKKWYASSLINGGVYALNIPSFVDEKLPATFSFEKEYLEKFYIQRKMYGFVKDEYFIDIGIPEDYSRAQTELLKHI